MSAKEPVGEILIERVENLRALNRKEEARRAAEEALRSLLSQGAPAEQIERLGGSAFIPILCFDEFDNVEKRGKLLFGVR